MFIFFSKYDIKILSAHFLYISVKQLFILRNPDCGSRWAVNLHNRDFTLTVNSGQTG